MMPVSQIMADCCSFLTMGAWMFGMFTPLIALGALAYLLLKRPVASTRSEG